MPQTNIEHELRRYKHNPYYKRYWQKIERMEPEEVIALDTLVTDITTKIKGIGVLSALGLCETLATLVNQYGVVDTGETFRIGGDPDASVTAARDEKLSQRDRVEGW